MRQLLKISTAACLIPLALAGCGVTTGPSGISEVKGAIDNGESDSQPGRTTQTAMRPVMDEASGELSGNKETASPLARQTERLREGIAFLRSEPDYTARFYRHERVEGKMQEAEEVDLQVRHEPFSVRMNWEDVGREVLYVEGENRDRMLVRLGGFKRIFGHIKLSPTSSTAMSRARYPITEAGLLRLAERILKHRERDLSSPNGVRCRELPGKAVDGRECDVFVVEYDSPKTGDEYSKSMICLDKEWNVPLAVKNWGWPQQGSSRAAADEDTLIEDYAFTDIEFDVRLADDDFRLPGKGSEQVAEAPYGQ